MVCIYTYKGKQYSEQEIKDIVFKEKVKPEDIKFATLDDIANILAYSNSKIILDGWKVEYSTPLGNKYDTLEEVNNEIRGLADANVEIDLSGVKLPIDNDVKKVEDIPVDEFRGVDGRTFKKIDNKWYDARIKIDWKDDTKQEVVEIPTNILQTNSEILYQYNSRNGSFDGNDFVRNDFKGFIEKNKEYEQSKEIIEQWKKENNIKYDPEEVYSRGQGFYSSIGAYSNFDVNLLFQNLISHLEDQEKVGGKYTISAFTDNVDENNKKSNIPKKNKGSNIFFEIFPQSKDIEWAATKDVNSGSTLDAHEKISNIKAKELLGVSYTKSPSLYSLNDVVPSLAESIDNVNWGHNELGINLTFDNFVITYEENVDYSLKKLIDNINNIINEKRLRNINNFIETLEKDCK